MEEGECREGYGLYLLTWWGALTLFSLEPVGAIAPCLRQLGMAKQSVM